jgi:hypothetical protein
MMIDDRCDDDAWLRCGPISHRHCWLASSFSCIWARFVSAITFIPNLNSNSNAIELNYSNQTSGSNNQKLDAQTCATQSFTTHRRILQQFKREEENNNNKTKRDSMHPDGTLMRAMRKNEMKSWR